MAAKAWGAGAWAADAEEEGEQELPEIRTTYSVQAKKEEEAFPTLGDAMAKLPKSKKKGTTLSLSEFTTGKSITPFGRRGGSSTIKDDGKLTTDEMMKLPRGPRERDEAEEEGALGGGFRGYGGFRGGAGGGFGDREERERDFDGPSRADDADWGAAKKFVPSAPGGARREDEWRGGGGGGGDRDGPSRADEADNWGAAKKFVPSAGGSGGGGGGFERRGGSGFDDERRERGGGFDDGPSRADEVSNWGAAKKFVPSAPGGAGGARESFGGRGSAGADSDRWVRADLPSREVSRAGERPRLVLQKRAPPAPEASGSAGNEPKVSEGGLSVKPDPFGGAKPREEVSGLEVLVKEGGSGGGSGPGSRDSSQPQTPEGGEAAAQARRRALNPFGDAKPREVLLEEKGKDWKKMDMDLEHRAIARPETEEEKKLKEEIEVLKARIEGGGRSGVTAEGEGEKGKEALEGEGAKGVDGEEGEEREEGEKEGVLEGDMGEQLKALEAQLAKLTHDLDDKVRFAQKTEFGRRESLFGGGERERGVGVGVGRFGEVRSERFADRDRDRVERGGRYEDVRGGRGDRW